MLADINELALSYYDPFDRCAFWRIRIEEDQLLSRELARIRRRALYDADVDACVKFENEVNKRYAARASAKLKLLKHIPVKPGDIVEVDINTQMKTFIYNHNHLILPFGDYSNPVELLIWDKLGDIIIPANYWGVYHHRVAFDHRPYKIEILSNLTYSKENGLHTFFKLQHNGKRCYIKTKTILADPNAYIKSFRKMIHSDKAPLFYTINKNEKWIIYTDLFC